MVTVKKIQRSIYSIISSKKKLITVLLSVVSFGFLIGCLFLYQVNAYFSIIRHTSYLLPYLDNILQRDATNAFCSPVPIDVVYTWVNGSDPSLIADLAQYMEQHEALACESDVASPCLSTNESLIALRQDIWLPYYRVRPFLYNESHAIMPTACHSISNIIPMHWIGFCKPLYLSMENISGALEAEKMLLVKLSSDTPLTFNLTDRLPLKWRLVLQTINHPKHHSVVLRFNSPGFMRQFYREMQANTTFLGVNGTLHSLRYVWPGLVSINNASQESAATHRFWDNEELRYSLRSLYRYAPWVRQVFIITNGQIPQWLRLTHPRIRLVTHRELFTNQSHLPTFNSAAIESHLHRVPGLSRFFIYMNDDVFFGQAVYPEDFYTRSNGYKIYLTWPVPNCREGCPNAWIADGFCDRACNYSVCEWDGGDCLESGQKTKSGAGERSAMGRGLSVDNVLARQPCKYGCADNWLADRYCDRACNVPECGFDAGDCGSDQLMQLDQIRLTQVPESNYTIWATLNRTLLTFDLSEVFDGSQDYEYSGHYKQLSKVRTVGLAQRYHYLFVYLYYNETRLGDVLHLMLDARMLNGTSKKIDIHITFTEKLDSFSPGKVVVKQFPTLDMADIDRMFTGYPSDLRFPVPPAEVIDNVMDPATVSLERRMPHQRKLLASYADSLLYTNRLFTRLYGYELRKVPGHMPHFIDRDVLLQVMQRFKPLWEQTSANRIRSDTDLQFAFTYYHFLLSEKHNRSVEEWLSSWDTDHSGTLDSVELETARLDVFGKSPESVSDFVDVMNSCSNFTVAYRGPWNFTQTIPLRNISTNCSSLSMKLSQQAPVPRFTYSIGPESAVWFKMLHPNCTSMRKHFEELLLKPRKFICLNDDLPHEGAESACVKSLTLDLLKHLFPFESDFELPNGEENGFATVAEWLLWQQQQANIQKLLLFLFISFCALGFLMCFFRKLKRLLLHPRRAFNF